MKLARISLPDARKLGFKCSKNLWTSCLNNKERHPGGRKPLDSKIVTEINNHLEDNSTPAANRVIRKRIIGPSNKLKTVKLRNGRVIKKAILQKDVINVRYLQLPLVEANHNFKSNIKSISFSSFYKYIHTKFKKAHHDSDLCEYCNNHKRLSNQVIKFTDQNFNDSFNHPFDMNDLFQYYKDEFEKSENEGLKERLETIIKKIEHIKELDFHREMAHKQRIVYNEMRKDNSYLKENLLIELDYKQKLLIGLGPLSGSYYKQRQISYLSFGVYVSKPLLDDTGGFIKDEIICYNFDILSDYTTQDASTVIRAFKFLRNLERFKQIQGKIKNYTIWSDCGSHFRNETLVNYFFTELAEEGFCVNWNIFAEKHGKSQRDQHFSVVSGFLNKEFKSLTTAQEVCDCIIKHQQISNNICDSYIFQTYCFVVNPQNKESFVIRKRKIENMNDYYNLQNKIKIETNEKNEIKFTYELFSSKNAESIYLTKIDEYEGLIGVDSVQDIDTKTIEFKNPDIYNPYEPLDDDDTSHLKNKRLRIERRFELKPTPPIQIQQPTTSRTVELDINRKPAFCKNDCINCFKTTAFKLSEIDNNHVTNINSIQQELRNHGHPSSLYSKKKKRWRNALESRFELKEHYKFFHADKVLT